MWPILGPLENPHHPHVQRSLFTNPLPKSSNIRYTKPISWTCLIIYTLILLSLCILPIFALNIYFRQALETFSQEKNFLFE